MIKLLKALFYAILTVTFMVIVAATIATIVSIIELYVGTVTCLVIFVIGLIITVAVACYRDMD